MTQPRDSKGRFMKKQPINPIEQAYNALLKIVVVNYEQVIANKDQLIALFQEIIRQQEAVQPEADEEELFRAICG